MYRKGMTALAIGLATLTVANIAFARGYGNNPLHPSYYTGLLQASGTVERYVDKDNPLSPSYRISAEDWMATAGKTVEFYVDSRNPLYPQFKR